MIQSSHTVSRYGRIIPGLSLSRPTAQPHPLSGEALVELLTKASRATADFAENGKDVPVTTVRKCLAKLGNLWKADQPDLGWLTFRQG